jgi:hypothetical protein
MMVPTLPSGRIVSPICTVTCCVWNETRTCPILIRYQIMIFTNRWSIPTTSTRTIRLRMDKPWWNGWRMRNHSMLSLWLFVEANESIISSIGIASNYTTTHSYCRPTTWLSWCIEAIKCRHNIYWILYTLEAVICNIYDLTKDSRKMMQSFYLFIYLSTKKYYIFPFINDVYSELGARSIIHRNR